MKTYRIHACITGALFALLNSCYYTTQAYYLFKYTYDDAKHIEVVLSDPSTLPDTKAFLENVKAIKAFLRDYAHLNTRKTYNSYTELERDYLVAVVQAAPELGIMPYMWNYPFMGKLPYRGYYNIQDAQKEAKKLREKNYDVLIRRVRAFSTLNALPDPLYSFMKQYSEGDLVQLIAHEQTHATIWISGQSAFNEQLASFVGRQSALDYIKRKYGEQSPEYQYMQDSEKNARAFRAFLYEVRKALESVYADNALTKDKKRAHKKRILTNAQEDFVAQYDDSFTDDSYKHIDVSVYNNAFFATISLYEENNTMFEQAYESCDKRMSKFIDTLKAVQKAPHKQKPYVFLQTMCTK